MKFDWTVKKVDFMKEVFEAVKKQEDLEVVLTDYQDRLFCGDCAFLDVCNLVEQNLSCYDFLKTAYKEYCEKFEKEATEKIAENTKEKIAEKTKEEMIIFIEFDDAIEETLRVTADQYKVIKHLAEGDYFKEDVRIYKFTQKKHLNLTDFT